MLRMKDPAHPGELVGATLEEMGVSISEAARQLGVSRQLLHGIIAGRNPVSPNIAVRLEAGLGSTAETWLRMQMNYDLAQIRKRDVQADIKRIAPKVA